MEKSLVTFRVLNVQQYLECVLNTVTSIPFVLHKTIQVLNRFIFGQNGLKVQTLVHKPDGGGMSVEEGFVR